MEFEIGNGKNEIKAMTCNNLIKKGLAKKSFIVGYPKFCTFITEKGVSFLKLMENKNA